MSDEATPVAVSREAPDGSGIEWWFIHHPDGFLIDIGPEARAKRVAKEINAGRDKQEKA